MPKELIAFWRLRAILRLAQSIALRSKEHPMPNQTKSSSEMSCANCSMRKFAETHPQTWRARFWRWHTGWCPGWKAYQAALAAEGAGKPKA